ncbi:Uncharacterised protein [Mycobacteroides abscessus subsp. abscessus]|nr:Uncharacterised protein [Mycobacteroides abscessus subsp. abscessus]
MGQLPVGGHHEQVDQRAVVDHQVIGGQPGGGVDEREVDVRRVSRVQFGLFGHEHRRRP